MSLRVGLGASQADLDVQGEIDFDFFDESSCSSGTAKLSSNEGPKDQSRNSARVEPANYKTVLDKLDLNSSIHSESASSYNFNKPMITISCDDATGAIQKTFETVIPSPYSYKDNKCGKRSPAQSRKVPLSPRLKSKLFKDDSEFSDDSSISSMSESESEISSVSEDSFELNDSDSMTDVSPLSSPFKASSPIPPTDTTLDHKSAKREGVKFKDSGAQGKDCSKCDMIDLQELIRAVKRLKMKQTVHSAGRRVKSPILTHNAKSRKNMSFSNEEVRRIDNDNQLLLKKIIAQQNRMKPLANSSSVHLISPATVNRQKRQRQIEFENLALLKRLESTKPSRDLSRIHLLHDYDSRSSGVLSRASSSHPCSSSSHSFRSSVHSSGRSTAVSKSASHLSDLHSSAVMNKP